MPNPSPASKPLFTEESPQVFRDLENNFLHRVKDFISTTKELSLIKSEWVRCLGPYNRPSQLNLLEAAILLQRYSLLDGLLEKICPAENDSLSIIIAAGQGNMQLVRCLNEHGAHTNAQHSEALIWAIAGHHNDVALCLIDEFKVSPSAGYNRSVLVACEFDNAFLAKKLIEKYDIDPTKLRGVSINLSLSKKHYDTVVMLYEQTTLIGLDPLKNLNPSDKSKVLELVNHRANQNIFIEQWAKYFCHDMNEKKQGPIIPSEVATQILHFSFIKDSNNTYRNYYELDRKVRECIPQPVDEVSQKLEELKLR